MIEPIRRVGSTPAGTERIGALPPVKRVARREEEPDEEAPQRRAPDERPPREKSPQRKGVQADYLA